MKCFAGEVKIFHTETSKTRICERQDVPEENPKIQIFKGKTLKINSLSSTIQMDVDPRSLYGCLFFKFLNVYPFDCTAVTVSGKVGLFNFRLASEY